MNIKNWIIFLIVLFGLCIQIPFYHPVYHWKDPNIIIIELKSWKINENDISLVYIKNDYTNKEKLVLCLKMKF